MFKILGIILVALASVQCIPNAVDFPLNWLKLHYAENFLQELDFWDINEDCKRDVTNLITGEEPMAFQMFDSIIKSVDGLLMGHLKVLGHFDECVSVKTKNFRGQHCMIPFQFPQNRPFSGNNGGESFDLSNGLAVCLPSTCNISDINNVVSLIKISGIDFLNVTAKDCSTDDFPPFRTEDWITLSIVIGLILLACASTFYEYQQVFVYKNENPNQLWTSFSLYKNSKFIFKTSQSSAQLKCLNGIRFFSMTWVILGHAYVTFLWGAPMNILDGLKIMVEKSAIPVNNAFVSVDSFFFLSGLLVCIVFFRDISKKGSFDVPLAFIHRYLRLTPPFAFLMLLSSTIVSRLGNGPLWKTTLGRIEDSCRTSWWSGILYIQNFLSSDTMCLGQSWYLSADMQMFWVSPLILYPMLFFPSFAPFFLIVLILGAAFINFTIGYVNELNPRMDFLDPLSQDQFSLEYTPFYSRMAPYLIGMLTGYVICGIQAKKIRFKLSRMWVIIGWIACFSLLGGSLFSIVRFIDQEYSSLEAAFYLAFHRVGWALGLSWLVLACVAGYGGPINYILSLDIFQPLVKLSYCNFLVHMTLQLIRISQSRVSLYIGHFEILYYYFGDLVLSYMISIPLCLLFELPFISIDRHFFQKRSILPFPAPKEKKYPVERKDNVEEKDPVTEKFTPMEKDPVEKKEEKPDKASLDDNMEKGIDNPNFKES